MIQTMSRLICNYLYYKKIFFVALHIFSFTAVMAQSTPEAYNIKVLDGTNKGINIKIKNPYVLPGNKYCIEEISVNDNNMKNTGASDIEIDLSTYKKGTYINIEIKYHSSCKPEILNPEVLYSKSTYELVAIEAKENQLTWTTKNETTQEPFTVEQKIYNKWVELGKLIGHGTPGYNYYNFQVDQYSGNNEYRIKQRDINGKYKYSEVANFESALNPITFYPDKVENCLYLSRRTKYQIFTEFGVLVIQGEGYQIKLPNLEPGPYYLYIDNRIEKIVKQ